MNPSLTNLGVGTSLSLRKTFFGPPRGIQGSGDLPDLVRANPDAVPWPMIVVQFIGQKELQDDGN